ncbi:unnamed protein product [Ectocarpus sp. CCAP 1310/34]|nr:unnamed protein product [Ectocarpus sp. CCAP 1310/34]
MKLALRCSRSTFIRRWRRCRRAPTSLPTNDWAAGANEDTVGDGGFTGRLDDNDDSSASCIELSGSDDGSEDDDHDDGGVAEETETDLDAELRNALLSTPLDVPTHRPSQSPTFQLLRAIAESPVAPPSGSTSPKPNNIFSQAATSSSAKGKKKMSSSSPGARGDEGLARWLGREEGRAKSPRTGGGEGVGKGARKTTTMMSMDSPPGTSGAATASPVVSRKRPRSSPPGSGNAHGSLGNPFEAYGHNCRPCRPPPPPSSRLGVDSGSRPPIEVALVGAGSDDDESDSISAGASGQTEVGSQDPPPGGGGSGASAQAEASPRRVAAGGAGSDLSQSGDDGSDFAVTPTPCRRGTRGVGGSGGTDRSGRPSPHGDGSLCSPFMLVDLSQHAEEEGSAAAAARVSGRTKGGGGERGGGRGGDVEGGGGGGVEEGEIRRRGGGGRGGAGRGGAGAGTPGRNTEVLPSALTEGEAAAGEGDDAPSLALSSDCLSPAGDRGPDAGQDRGGSEGVGGGDRGGEELLQLKAAKRLYFLVSGNTGRVHVYKKVGGDDEDGNCSGGGGGGGGGGGVEDDEEEARPQHCRCNFRPEDLDRLFEAAKEALLLSTATTTGPSTPTSRKLAAEACEAAAREALSTLPKLLWSAPALRVARGFVQEWRALSSRKRPLLKGTPCRPPLADELSRVTPALTGSKRRYAGTVGGRSTSGGPAGDGEGGGSAAGGEVNGGASGRGNDGGGGSGSAGSSAARSGGTASNKARLRWPFRCRAPVSGCLFSVFIVYGAKEMIS